jgi:hypothetical protein
VESFKTIIAQRQIKSLSPYSKKYKYFNLNAAKKQNKLKFVFFLRTALQALGRATGLFPS